MKIKNYFLKIIIWNKMTDNYSILLCTDSKDKSKIETKISNEDIEYIKSLNVNWYLWKGRKNKFYLFNI